MARIQSVQSSFSEGRISPRLQGFVDLPAYQSACKTIENAVVLPQGATTKRPGTHYVAETKSNLAARLVPFTVGLSQSYVLEFTNNALRVYSQDLQLQYHASSSSSGVYEKSTTYTTAQLDDLDFTQSADVLFIAHPDHKPRKLVRDLVSSGNDRADDDSQWTLSDLVFEDGPYADINTDTNDVVTLSGTDKFETTDIGDFFVDPDLNQLVRKNHGLLDGQTVWVKDIGAGTITFLPASSTSGDTSADSGSTSDHKKFFVVNATSNTIQITTSMTSGIPDAYSTLAGTGDLRVNIEKQTFKKGTTGVTITVGFTDATCDYNNDPTITMDSTSKLVEGMTVTGTGIPAGATVSSITNSTTFELSASTTGGSVTNGTLSFTANPFEGNSNDEGKSIRINPLPGSQIKWGYVEITGNSGSSATVAQCTIKEEIVSDNASYEWQKSVWDTTNGYPRSVALYQQRLVFAGTKQYPATIWFSNSGDFYNFAQSQLIGVTTGNLDSTGANIVGEQILDTNSVVLTIDSDTVDQIEWLKEGKKLTMGTSGGVFSLYGSENDLTITPFNFTIQKVADWETEPEALPVAVGNQVLYVQKNGRKVRELAYEAEKENFEATDITLRAEDITYTGIKEMAYQDSPSGIVWARLLNGKLIAVTYNKNLNLYGWSTHTIGGSHTDATYGNHAKVERITVIPRGTHDQVWMVVKRTIAGATKRYVEYITSYYDEQETIQEKAHFLDSGGKKESTNTDATTSTTRKFNGATGVNASTNLITTTTDHGLSIGDAVYLTTAGTIPPGLTASTTTKKIIYIVKTTPASTTLTLCEDVTEAGGLGTDIDITATGSGDVFITKSGFKYVTGLSYLEGQTVSILGDGALQPQRVVSATGTIGLQTVCTTHARVGLPYTTTVTTLPRVKGVGDSFAVTGTKRLLTVNMMFLETLGASFGMEGGTLDEILFRDPVDFVYGTKVPLFSGVKELVPADRSFSSEGVTIQSNDPFPLTLLRLAFEYEVNI